MRKYKKGAKVKVIASEDEIRLVHRFEYPVSGLVGVVLHSDMGMSTVEINGIKFNICNEFIREAT